MDSIAASTHARERTSFTLSLAGLGQRMFNTIFELDMDIAEPLGHWVSCWYENLKLL